MSRTTARDDANSAWNFLAGRVNYERQPIPQGTSDFRLDRMRRLLERLGDPHLKVPALHLAGTKGKGSTAAMIAGALSASGYRTALYTSPHLDSLAERFRLDGVPCPSDVLVRLVERVRPAVIELDGEAQRGEFAAGPTWFEITTAMAFLYFAQQQADISVLEVGLGGRLDSTNVCLPLVSVITSISFDHMAQLGHTLGEIAGEKAGIIKPGVPVVSGVTQPEPGSVIARRAAELNCPLVQLEVDFFARYFAGPGLCGQIDYEERGPAGHYELKGAQLGLAGPHQGNNGAVALATLRTLATRGWRVAESALRAGLALRNWPARMETVAQNPLVIIDSAHNGASAEALVETLRQAPCSGRRVLVLAVSREKDIARMLAALLPFFDAAIFTRYGNNPRGLPPEELLAAAQAHFSEADGEPHPARSNGYSAHAGRTCEMHVCPAAHEAWQMARQLTGTRDLICITGSFFIAAELRPLAIKA